MADIPPELRKKIFEPFARDSQLADAFPVVADTASTFFQENASGDLGATEGHVSGGFTVSLSPSPRWTASAGIGSLVRTADAAERYSDRIPASKAQTSAEFVGNPGLRPERSTQADLWLEATYPRWTLSANAFARRIDDYITLAPTDLPKRLPLSPETVFRYVNGEATFWGFETGAAYRGLPALQVEAQTHYLWGRDETLDEPVLGILPFGGALGLRGGLDVTANVSLQGGITNLLGTSYADHLNAKNPFTSRQIYEPGRVFFVDLTVAF